MWRSLWQRVLWWRFRLFQRHRYNRLVLEEVAGRPFLVLPQVFNPKLLWTGEFLAQTLDERLIPPGSTVLDMGTGSGVGAVFAASWAEHVVAVDINPEAVRCARINVLLNRVEERVQVCQGDLFEPVSGQRFDVVLFNPPFFSGTPQDLLDHAWRSDDVAGRFAAGLGDHLRSGGYGLVVLSTVGGESAFLQAFRARGLVVHEVARRAVGDETLTVYQICQE